MSTDDLRAFLEARLDEDEQHARQVEGDGHWDCVSTGVLELGGVPDPNDRAGHYPGADLDGLVLGPRGVVYHAARHDPARVLREVAAKRALLAMDVSPDEHNNDCVSGYLDAVYDVQLLLAAVWSDHPDYRTEWSTA
jgi:hypothetical protein